MMMRAALLGIAWGAIGGVIGASLAMWARALVLGWKLRRAFRAMPAPFAPLPPVDLETEARKMFRALREEMQRPPDEPWRGGDT